MKRNLLQIGLTILLSSSLFGFTYEIKDGWQQVGAIQDIDDLSIFNNAGCVDHVWYYDNTNTADPQWKLHIANGNTYNYCGETLTSLKKGQGFWVKATGECTITIDEPVCPTSNMPAPPDLENGTCDTNTTTPTGVATGEASSLEVISSHLDAGSGNIANKIVTSTDIVVTDNSTYSYFDGYFYDENSNAVIKINESFRLWTTPSKDFPGHNYGGIKITNMDTNNTVITYPYPESTVLKTYYLMTDTLPAGTYKLESAGTGPRMNDGFFFEAVR